MKEMAEPDGLPLHVEPHGAQPVVPVPFPDERKAPCAETPESALHSTDAMIVHGGAGCVVDKRLTAIEHGKVRRLLDVAVHHIGEPEQVVRDPVAEPDF